MNICKNCGKELIKCNEKYYHKHNNNNWFCNTNHGELIEELKVKK